MGGKKIKSCEADKAQRLSLAELAAHDDVCSDVLIDNAYYKARIRKNRAKHFPIRGIKEEEVPKILLQKVIVDKDLAGAEKALLALPGLKRYKKSLRTKIEKERFLSHLRKYIALYSTDCAWEVSTTNRYTIVTYEAAVTARRRIKQGDKVKYLIGTLVPLTTEESADLDMTNRNFSIVVSSRKKNSSIFLGPARFANHDCDANGRLVTTGPDGMEVVAMKNIEVGDEITVSYGDDYFGPNNIDCLCHTCEILERNGWTPTNPALEPGSQLSTPGPASRSASKTRNLKRKYDPESTPSSLSSGPAKKIQKSTQSPSKLQHSWTPPAGPDADVADNADLSASAELQMPPITAAQPTKSQPALSPPHSPSRSEEIDVRPSHCFSASALSDGFGQITPVEEKPIDPPKPSDSARESKMAARLLSKASRSPLSPAPTSPSSLNSILEANRTDPESQDQESHVTIKVESVETTKVETDADTIIIGQNEPQELPSIANNATSGQSTLPEAVTETVGQEVVIPHVVSTLTTTTVTRDVHGPGFSTSQGENQVLPSIEQNSTSATVASLTVHPVTGTIRIAGDYILTRKLLAQPHDRWIQCHNTKCYGFFIQPNGYQTRRECPRCERHSMLYGFPWPKTDPDPRKLLERKTQSKKRDAPAVEYSAYRRHGRTGKGTWVEGGGDEEERVMDHRTIHRFVLPEEERDLTRKGLLQAAEKAREAGDRVLARLEARLRAGSRGQGTESSARDASESNGSATPDDARRRSNRFVTRPVGVYTDRG
ncbi:hypothetical protein B0A52_07361 [Exophiala mesophila]|uniref:Histone-lysine N-methyltransferase SET9 n=1 Tax=Exophiala mesophila TaxID=212818 RepID=A0A438MX88_EXOME|nr:hypothetical protein B0A52_07361 [Exophiala mesophila]